MGASWGVSDAPQDVGIIGAHMTSPMLFLFLGKNYAFDWKEFLFLEKITWGGS